MKPKKNNNNNNNYFSQNIQKYGQDFLKYKNARDLEFDALKIFRELARERIDISKYGGYFLNSQFLNSCILAAERKYIHHNISWTGVNAFVLTNPQAQSDINVMSVLNEHKNSTEAYNIILNILNIIRATGDPNHLYSLVNQLKRFRNAL